MFAKNEAVSDQYTKGYAIDPTKATESHNSDPKKLLIWHENYHLDGDQLFYPLDNQTFLCPLALPGDDLKPDDFICFYFKRDQGLYFHPNIWYEGLFPIKGKQNFFTKQGAEHGRVSFDLAEEFKFLLGISLTEL